jgi:hypothetical protein
VRCEQKVPYASQMLAQNAAWLHLAAYPECGGIEPYPCRCGDWHTGHVSPAAKAACVSSKRKPPLWRPARWSRGHRHPSARDVAR